MRAPGKFWGTNLKTPDIVHTERGIYVSESHYGPIFGLLCSVDHSAYAI